MALTVIWGRPYIDLEPYFDPVAIERLDDEICRALTEVALEYTGGSHKWMGIVPPSLEDDRYLDYGQVIEGFSRDEFADFIALSDEPERFDVDRRHEYEFGEEREHPLSRRQMLYLKFKHGVYFPWKAFYELVPSGRWAEKSDGSGKGFTGEAEELFPNTVAFIRSLPFTQIGRCILLGLEANDHGTVHRDGDPDEKPEVDHFIVFCPRKNKRLFLWDEEMRRRHEIHSRIYWFNDSDYHGVAADPFFRYSIRVDGTFRRDFLDAVASGSAVSSASPFFTADNTAR